MAGEISPPKFRLDRFLRPTEKQIQLKDREKISQNERESYTTASRSPCPANAQFSGLVEWKTYRATTDMEKFPQKTPLHEQKSSSWTSSQSSKTLATLLNDALIDINAFPAQVVRTFYSIFIKSYSGRNAINWSLNISKYLNYLFIRVILNKNIISNHNFCISQIGKQALPSSRKTEELKRSFQVFKTH